jgi:hypothetical protein
VDRLDDILDRQLAQVLVVELEPVTHLLEDRARRTDSTRRGLGLEPGGNVHAVAVDIPALDDHVAQVDADAKAQGFALGRRLGVLLHAGLPRERAGDRVDHARELQQQAVAHQLDHAPAVLRDQGLEEIAAQAREARERACLVPAHEAGIADHVGDQYRGESAFHEAVPKAASGPTARFHAKSVTGLSPSALSPGL